MDQCSGQRLTLMVLSCHPGAWHSRAYGSFLFWIECAVVRLAVPAGQTSEAAHHGFSSNCCSGYSGSGQVATLPVLPALSNACPRGAQVGPAICRAGNYTPALQPLEFFLWTHRKHHLLLQKNHCLWSDSLRARAHCK